MNTQLDKIKALRAKEEQGLVQTLLVDIYTQVNRKDVADIAEPLAEMLELKYKLVTDLVNKATPPNKIAAATTAIKLTKIPGAFLIITDSLRDVRGWATTYSNKAIRTFIYLKDEDRYLTADEYIEIANEIFSLDTIQIQQTRGAKITVYKLDNTPDYSLDITREDLEDLAESFGAVTGWTFSGPIRRISPTPQALSSLRETTILPSAGFGNSGSGFAETIRPFHDTLIEVAYPESKTTITPSRQTILKKGKAVSTSELQAFAEYFYNLTNLDEHLHIGIAIDGWDICSCGNPVRTIGELEEDGFCPYCDRAIPGYVARVYQSAEYLAKPDPNYILIERAIDNAAK